MICAIKVATAFLTRNKTPLAFAQAIRYADQRQSQKRLEEKDIGKTLDPAHNQDGIVELPMAK